MLKIHIFLILWGKKRFLDARGSVGLGECWILLSGPPWSAYSPGKPETAVWEPRQAIPWGCEGSPDFHGNGIPCQIQMPSLSSGTIFHPQRRKLLWKVKQTALRHCAHVCICKSVCVCKHTCISEKKSLHHCSPYSTHGIHVKFHSAKIINRVKGKLFSSPRLVSPFVHTSRRTLFTAVGITCISLTFEHL